LSPRCDVIIPVKDAVWWVEKCLEELFRCTDPSLLEKVLVVNDRSSKESSVALEEICARFRVELLQNENPSGFAGACNFAAERSRAPNLLFLNTDCLITPRAIEKLLRACERDPSIGLACPLSNNSPVLTLPMSPGRSYLEMNELLERITQGRAFADVVFDACTVVGNCLLITRKCWEATGGFDPGWGLGYGEETDYQFRAMRLGFRGVVLTDTYVYHFGNASFRYQTGFAELQKRNLELFHSKWGRDFVEYQERCDKRDPIRTITRQLDQHEAEPIRADVLFVLEGISQTIGGVHVVIEICNYLLRHGVNAKCLVLGELEESALQRFAEPILSGLIHRQDEGSFIADHSINARMVVATLFKTAAPAFVFARMQGIPLLSFVQGYEFLFDNGRARDEVEQAYWLPDAVLTTSPWLEAGVKLRTPAKPVSVLPIGVEQYLFLPPDETAVRGKIRIAMFLRREPDKGQAVLLEVLDQLLRYRDEIAVTVFSEEHTVPRGWFQAKDTQIVHTPVDKGTIARYLRRCDILVDASLHEGFGVVPLEAMACGATVVASDSGGVNQFLRDGQNGILIKEVNKPERFVAEIARLVRDRRLLASLRRESLNTARQYTASSCYQRYFDYFEQRLQRAQETKAEAPIVRWVPGDRRISVLRDLLPNEGGSYVLRPRRRRASVTIPGHVVPSRTAAVVKLQLFSSAQQTLTVPYRNRAGSVRPPLSNYLRLAAQAVRELRGRASSSGLHLPVQQGWNELLIELPEQDAAEPFRLEFEGRSESVLSSLEIRLVSPSEGGASFKQRFDASTASAWKLESAANDGLLAERMDLLPYPAGHYRAFGKNPSLLLPEVPWPPDGTLIGWFDFSVPDDTTAQLFYLSGPLTEYSQEASIPQLVKRGRNIFTVKLTANLTGRLRFDPGKVKGDYEIHEVCLYSRGPSSDLQRPIARSA